MSDLLKHGCGATSTQLDEQWDDLPLEGLRAAARRFAYGRSRHGKGNWKKGDAEFANERLNHMLRHAHLFSEHRRQEDLDAVLCNAMMLADYKARGLMPEQESANDILKEIGKRADESISRIGLGRADRDTPVREWQGSTDSINCDKRPDGDRDYYRPDRDGLRSNTGINRSTEVAGCDSPSGQYRPDLRDGSGEKDR